MFDGQAALRRIRAEIRPDRLLDTAVRLIGIPSPTRSAGAVTDELERILRSDGFDVSRAECGWPTAPAIVARFASGAPGRTIQFNGHLDTVHLPFVPPRIEDGKLYGSGSSDMKGGIAAMVEAARAVRASGLLSRGAILLTAHELHESPWGDGSQVDGLIAAGHLGDAVLLPEYCADPLPVAGRGLAILEMAAVRDGVPVHEVLGGIDGPSVIRAAAELVRGLGDLDESLRGTTHPYAGRASAFVGSVHAGEIYNQSPVRADVTGTRRWLPGTDVADVQRGFEELCEAVGRRCGVRVEGTFRFVRDAYEIDPADPFVEAFQAAHADVTSRPLPIGGKPFVDDGNTFVHRGRIPAITHGPAAKGAHTLHEEVPVAELVRTAEVYAMTALRFCGAEQ